MPIEMLSKSKNEVEFKLMGERHTFPQLLVGELLKNEHVDFAAYKLEHPLNSDSIVLVRTKDKDPVKVVDDTCKVLEKQLEEFQKKLKAIK